MPTELKSEIFEKILNEQMASRLKKRGFSDQSRADPRSKGLAFLRFYLEEIFSQTTDIDEELIDEGIVDKANDLGIDFVCIDDKTVNLIQSKYGSTGTNKETLEHFVNLPKNLKENPQYCLSKANSELRPYIEEILKIENPTFELIYITNQKISQEDINYYEQKCPVSCKIVSFSQLRQEYSSIQTMGEEAPEMVTFNLGNEDCLALEELQDDHQYPTVILTQKGSKLRNIYQQHKEALFNHNIRFWLGKNAVNSAMIETIQNEPDRFFYYNNGVTAVCEEYSFGKDGQATTLNCKNLQIINGAQTVTTIAKEEGFLNLVEI